MHIYICVVCIFLDDERTELDRLSAEADALARSGKRPDPELDRFPDFDRLADMRDDEELQQQNEQEEQDIDESRRIRTTAVYLDQLRETQKLVVAPGWQKFNQGYPYMDHQQDRNWIATEYARKCTITYITQTHNRTQTHTRTHTQCAGKRNCQCTMMLRV